MLQTRLALGAQVQPSPSSHLHIERLDAAWESAFLEYPQYFQDIGSLSFSRSPVTGQAERLRERLRVPRPFCGITQISAPQPYAWLEGLHLGAKGRAVTAAHLASAAALPTPTPLSVSARSDVLRFFDEHPNLRVASFCRTLIPAAHAHRAFERHMAAVKRGSAQLPDDDQHRKRDRAVWQTLWLDIARSLYGVAKDIEQVEGAFLSRVIVVFDVTGLRDPDEGLRRALRVPCAIHDADSPRIGDLLQSTRTAGAPNRPLVWQVAFGTPQQSILGGYRLLGDTPQNLTVVPTTVAPIGPNPYAWSTLSASLPPPGLT